MDDLRLEFESNVFRWPDVTTKYMFGSITYLARGKLFGFIQAESIILTNLDEAARETLSCAHEAFPFESSGKTVGEWLEIVISDESEIRDIMPYVRKSYEAALAKPASRKEKKR